MKASKVRALYIVVMSSLCIGFLCAWTVLLTFFKRETRKSIDVRFRKMMAYTLKLVQVNYKVVNPYQVEPKANQPTIIMCNHSSLYDIPLSVMAFPNHSVRMLSKKEISNIPFMGKGMIATEFPFIDRRNTSQAIKDLDFAKTLLDSGIVMWIAPEGTRSKDGHIVRFKKGGFIMAINAKATIIPIGIRGANHILQAGSLEFNLNQTPEICIGQPIDASTFNLDNKDALIEKVFTEIKNLVEH